MSRALILAILAGCAPRAMPVTAGHPVNVDAPTGRLAGPPAALRPGVAVAPAPAPAPAAVDEHAGHGQQPAATPAAPEPTKPAAEEPPKPAPKPKAKKPSKPKQPAPSSPVPADKPKTPPAPQGHEGHH